MAVLAERDARILAAETSQPDVATAENTAVDKGCRSTVQEDLARQFEVAADALIALPETPGQALLEQYASLWHFYSLVGMGQTPAVTFKDLNVEPSAIHTMLGDVIWNGYWGEKSRVVTQEDYIPMTMHKVLHHLVGLKHLQLVAVAGVKETARVQFDAAKSRAAAMQLGYTPF